jgi:hypothetical protein
VTTSPETSNPTSEAETVTCPRCGEDVTVGLQQCPSCASFVPGNTAATLLLHGGRAATSPVFRAAVETNLAEIEAWVGDGPGSEDRFAGARLSAAIALTRVTLAGRLLDQIGMFDNRGKPRPALAVLESANNAFLMHLEKLGLTPTGAAKLAQKPTATDATDYLHRVAREAEADRARRRAKDAAKDEDEETTP